MLKRYVTVMFVSLFLTGFLFAQSQKVVEHQKVVLDKEALDNPEFKSINPPAVSNSQGDPIGLTTVYDYFSNSIIRDQIVYYAGSPHLSTMINPFDGNAIRHVIYSYMDAGSWVHTPVVPTAAGWPHIDVALTGSAAGTLGIVFHVPNRLAIWDGAGGFLVSQFEATTDPSMQFMGDNIFIASSGNRTQFQFWKTEDFGVSFTNYDSISTYSPSPIYYALNGGVEVGMSKSTNEMYMVHFGTIEGEGHVSDGVDPDSADNLWAIYTTDGGATFTGETIARDGVFDGVVGYHTDNYAPLIENFGQVDAAVANDGVMHFLANGYGLVWSEGRDSAIANAFPVLYWNSSAREWKSISDPAIDTIQAIADFYPTNSIGQAYPSISASPDGSVLYAMWTGPRLTAGGELDTARSGDEGTLTYYWRDLYHAFSTDGGDTWTYGGVFVGDAGTSAAFGHAAQHLEPIEGGFRAHIVYLQDLNTGVSLFAGGGPGTDNPIMYATFDIPATVNVGDGDLTVNSFELSQNYPNPFNPTTNIQFNIGERANVTLKVFDMLGREVATLINSVKEAGSHEVNFDASNLSSGLYVYTINAGNFSSSKKMMLMK
jgi:hypothetical protein